MTLIPSAGDGRVLIAALAASWSAMVTAPVVWWARRAQVVDSAEVRLGAGDPPRRPRHRRSRSAPGRAGPVASLGSWLRPYFERHFERHRHRRGTQRVERRIAGELPVTVDLLAVAVSAGCTPQLAVALVAGWAPPTSAAWLEDVQRRAVLGAGFSAALHDGLPSPQLRSLVDALLVSDRYGAPVGDALARLAVEARGVLRRRAETQARTVPVRLLFPLVFLVLPAFVLLTVAPALLTGLAGH